jgi:hypothetical protein
MKGQGAVADTYYFDALRLATLADRYRTAYATATPFPHVIMDKFLPDEVLGDLVSEFPRPADAEWQVLSHAREEKLALADDWQMPLAARHLLAQFNSSTFVNFLEDLTGISGLIPDPHFVGGGLHQIQRGGFLKVHADFNLHKHLGLYRRLNALVYLNRDWREEYGGHLQLWSRDMQRCERQVLPLFGRCVIFNTTDWSYHGHPDPLSCPEGMTRKSLALYYYTKDCLPEDLSPGHTTLFKARPNGDDAAVRLNARKAVKQFLPPVVVDAYRSMSGRIQRRSAGSARRPR